MAIDFKSLDKKKIAIIAGAILAGLIAVVLTNGYINSSVEEKTSSLGTGVSSREVQKLNERIMQLENANQSIVGQMRKLASRPVATVAPAAPPPVIKPLAPMLSTKTPQGKRAITLTIDKLLAVGGMVAPGDYVDIITHLNIPSDTEGSHDNVTLTLFQHVLVLAIGDNTVTGKKIEIGYSGSIPVTLALDPQEAGLISFARQHGKMQLILRSPFDNQAFTLPKATWQTLADYLMETQGTHIAVPGSEKKPEEKSLIEVFKGGQQQIK